MLGILDYISEHSEQAAERLFERIEQHLEHVAEHPYLYKPSHRMPGMREIVVHPNYLVFYRVTETCIEVLGIAHSRREFPYGPDISWEKFQHGTKSARLFSANNEKF